MKDKLKKLFIPHDENGFRPSFLEKFSMGIMLVLILISFAVANIQALLWVSSEWMISAVLPTVIVELTNEEREDDALITLKRNSILDKAAEMKAKDMAEKGYFAHYAPDGTSPWYWFEEAGYSYSKAGENLAVHFNDSGKVVDAWMKSPSHRANIMNGAYTEIGVGTARGEYKGSPTVFVVQLFGTPSNGVQVTDRIVSNIETSSTSSTPQLARADQTDDILGEEMPEPEATPVPESEPEEEQMTTEEPVAPVTVTEETPDEVTADDEVVVIYSDTATTSDKAVPATVAQDGGGTPSGALATNELSFSGFFKTVTQPSVWLQMVYLVLAVVVTISLIMAIVIEWQRQHPVQLAYAGGLLAVMALLLELHTTLTSGVTII